MVTSLPSARRQRPSASVLPSASPSGRKWLMTTKRWRLRRRSPISAKVQLRLMPRMLELLVVVVEQLRIVGNGERLQHLEHAVAALDRFVEIEVQPRRVLEHHALGEFLL